MSEAEKSASPPPENRRKRGGARVVYRFAVLALVFAPIAFAFWASRKSQPHYQGRSLTAWLDELSSGQFEDRARATNAIRAIGTNALPVLLALLREEDSLPASRFIDFLRRQSFLRLGLRHPSERYGQVALGFRVLGPLAAPAGPELERILTNGPARISAAFCLATIGPDNLPIFLRGLDSLDPDTLMGSIAAIAELHKAAQPAAPKLLRLAQARDPRVRRLALFTLGNIGPDPSNAVPLFISCLRDGDSRVRVQAAHALGVLGPRARSATPALLPLLSDPLLEVRSEAAEALRVIEPEAARRAAEKAE